MKRLAKILLIFLLVIINFSQLTTDAQAVCPVCTVAVGAGLGLSRWLGIDDIISGIWVGGLILSSSLWLIDWISKKKLHPLSINYKPLIFLGMYTFILLPLWYGKIIGNSVNAILGIDKILFGTGLGSAAFLFGVWADKKVREIKSRQLFNYQKVIFPLTSLVIASLLIYYYGGYLY